MEIFEYASKNSLRWSTSKGLLNSEDLWTLSLTFLNTLAVEIDEQLGKTAKSFIVKKTTSNKELEAKLAILVHIINYKVAKEEAAKLAADKASKKALLKELIEKKSLEGLSAKSIEELEKELAELEA